MRAPDDTAISMLKIHGGATDPIVARLRAEAMVGAVDLRPRALPPAAILCVRELSDPMPGIVSLVSRDQRPPRSWEAAMEREIDRIASAAAWPARGAVPPSAESVAFADEAELLACLASDLIAHRIGSRWWWALLVRDAGDPPRAVARAFVESVEHVPAALERLARRAEAAQFLSLLAAPDVAELRGAIARAFAVPVLAALTDAGSVPRAGPTDRVAAAASKEARAVPAPWAALAPEANVPGLEPERRALLGAALTLVRAPSIARSLAFAAATRAWSEAVVAAARPSSPLPVDAIAITSRQVEPAPAPQRKPLRATLSEPARGSAPRSALATPPGLERDPSFTGGGEIGPEVTPALDVAMPVPGIVSGPPARLPSSAPRTRARRAFGPAIDTELGGLFYLLNLALYLGLYGDDENLPLSPWDFVELVGERLLGQRDADAVWKLLAELSGRGDEPAGAHFTPEPDWRVPESWLPPALVPVAPAEPPDAPLERWLALLVPVLRARLQLALGLDASEDPAPLLLRHAARVHVDDLHVDVVLSLETLPIAIRLAGLDRDPGWIAAAGRFVAFHFE